MAGDQREREHPQSAERIDLGQRVELCQQHQRDGDGAEAANARILHDLEHAPLLPAAAETIHRVGEAVLVKGACDHQRGRHAGEDRQRCRQPLLRGDGDERADAADDDPHQRQVARGLLELLLRVADPGGHGQAGKEAQRGEEDPELADHARLETPADSKLAISSRMAQAAFNSG